MAVGIGEIFIELGILGNDKEAKKILQTIEKVKEEGEKAAEKLRKMQQHLHKMKFKQGKKIIADLKDVGRNIGSVITAVAGAVVALNKLADALAQQNQYWLNLINNSTTALSTYQKWGAVGAALDKSLGMQGAAGALKQLNDQIFEYKLTGQNAEGFLFAGIRPTNAEDVMEQLRARVSGMNDDAASFLLRKMGIDERILPLLRMTKQEFEDLYATINKYQLTEDQRRYIQEYNKQMTILNMKMQYFKDRILLAIMPHLLRLMDFVVKIVEKLPKIRGYIIAGGLILSKIKPIEKFIKYILMGLNGFITKIPIVGRLFGVLGGIIARAFLPLTAAFLLLEDFMVWQEGGESVIGDVINYFKEMGEDWLNIGKIFTTKPLEAFKYALVKIGDVFIKIAQAILNAIDAILGTPLGKWFRKKYGGEEYDANMDELRENLRLAARLIDEEKLAASAVSNDIYNNGNNDNSTKTVNYNPEYNVTIDSDVGQKYLNGLQQQDLAQVNSLMD